MPPLPRLPVREVLATARASGAVVVFAHPTVYKSMPLVRELVAEGAIDGIEVSDYIDPPLTTLCQPMEKMGRRSIEILLDMIEGRAGNFHEVLPTVLRVGGSVKKLV
mgnify:CR=1 FL=1